MREMMIDTHRICETHSRRWRRMEAMNRAGAVVMVVAGAVVGLVGAGMVARVVVWLVGFGYRGLGGEF